MGKKEAPKVKASTAKSAYSGLTNYNVDMGPFGSSSSKKSGNTLSTTSTLSPGLQGLFDTSSSGLHNNLDYLNQTPDEQLHSLITGDNNYYNLNSALNQQYLDNQLGSVQHRMAQNGLDNSTVSGGLQGLLLNDAVVRDLGTRQSALEYNNKLANQNAGTNNAILQGLAGILQYPTAMSNQNLQTGFNSQDQLAMFNATQLQNASKTNAELQAQVNAQPSFWGSMLQATGGALGTGLGNWMGAHSGNKASAQPAGNGMSVGGASQSLIAGLASGGTSPFMGSTVGLGGM